MPPSAIKLEEAGLLKLPFVRRSGGKIDCWAVEHIERAARSFNPAPPPQALVALGQEFARAAARHMDRFGSPALLLSAVSSMVAKRRFGPLEEGFLLGLGLYALHAARLGVDLKPAPVTVLKVKGEGASQDEAQDSSSSPSRSRLH